MADSNTQSGAKGPKSSGTGSSAAGGQKKSTGSSNTYAGGQAAGNDYTGGQAAGKYYAGGAGAYNGNAGAYNAYAGGANSYSGGYSYSGSSAGNAYLGSQAAGAYSYAGSTSTAASDDEIEIDLGELIAVVLKKFWLIFVVALVCGILGYCGSRFLIAETFESTTKIYILNSSSETTTTYSDLQSSSSLANDYAEIITSRAVLEPVMEQFGLDDDYTYDQFADKVDVDNPDSTRIIAITVTDTDPALAQELADAIRVTAADLIVETMQIDAVNTIEEANYPTEKAAPSNSRNAIIAAILGALVVIVVVVVRYLLDDTIKTSDDVEKYLGLSTLALIPLDGNIDVDERSTKKGRTKARRQTGKAARTSGTITTSRGSHAGAGRTDAAGKEA